MNKVVKRRKIVGILLMILAIFNIFFVAVGGLFGLAVAILAAVPGLHFVKIDNGPIYKSSELTLKITFYIFAVLELLGGIVIFEASDLVVFILGIVFITIIYSLGAPWGAQGYKELQYSSNSPKTVYYKKWWFYVLCLIMFIGYIISFEASVVSNMSQSSSTNNISESRKIKKLTPEERAEKNWKNHKIVASDGIFKIEKIAKIKAYTFGSDMVPGLLLVGKFTNKSSDAMSVTDFLDDHTYVTNVNKKTERDLDPTAYVESSPKYRQLFRNAHDKTRPGKTVSCAVHYMGSQAMGEDIPNNFRFEITNSNDEVLYKVDLKNLPIVKTNIE